jgi:hypothetical protein
MGDEILQFNCVLGVTSAFPFAAVNEATTLLMWLSTEKKNSSAVH